MALRAKSLQCTSSEAIGALRRAVDVFGFHLAPVDLRQNADVHERVVRELLESSGACPCYVDLAEEARVAVLLAEVRSPRPLASTHLSYTNETSAELDIASTWELYKTELALIETFRRHIVSCGCFTAAAARLAAAAGRAIKLSWRSRRARCRARSA